MRDDQPRADHLVTLLGNGPADPNALDRALSIAPCLVAADGGADVARSLGHHVKRIIGDLDSINYPEFWLQSGVEVTQLDEQHSTDFEKCLYTVSAALYVGVGFVGRRLDHTLACLRTLAAYPDKRVLLVGEHDVTFLCPTAFEIDIAAGDPVSFFPMAEVVAGPGSGLQWPLEGLKFAPNGAIGTSNRAIGGTVEVRFDRAACLMILPLSYLEAVASLLLALPVTAAPAKSGIAPPR